MLLGEWPSLPDLISLVRAADHDAEHRLVLVHQAVPALYEGAALDDEEREALADRFERWRYQILNHHGSSLSASLRDLTTVLDQASARLRGVDRSPRNPRVALSVHEGARWDPVVSCLDRSTPLEDVTRRAAEMTAWTYSASEPGCQSSDHPDSLHRRILLYAPLYLSNYCINHCLYCSFRHPHALERVHLSLDEVRMQAGILRERGFRHILLVAGDFPRLTSVGYLSEIVAALTSDGVQVGVEIAPQSTLAYSQLKQAGARGVTLYQETYQEAVYAHHHPHGSKVWFDWRLEGPDRAAEAGFEHLGLGVLLGLADPTQDLLALIGHGMYLRDRFPQIQLSFGLPRIHAAPDNFEIPCPVDDETFIRSYCALRMAFPTAGLVLSTRECPALRDRLAVLCITQMSAGSSTSPGGYRPTDADPRQRQQFPVGDHRTIDEVVGQLRRSGLEITWDLCKSCTPS